MKNLNEYFNITSLSNHLCESSELFESHMQNKDWTHRGDYKYAMAVIKILINGDPVELGDKKSEGVYQATPDEIEKLKQFDPTEHTTKDFDNIFDGRLYWRQIFKGMFSGYAGGLASGNRGNAFEDEYVNNFHNKYQTELEKALKFKPGELNDYEAQSRGGENQKRPLIMKGKSIVLSSNHETVGESVVDVEVSVPVQFRSSNKDNQELNLSLKYGKKVTFCNAGIANLFPGRAFDNYKSKGGVFEPGKVGQVDGSSMLKMFGIDPNKFADVFINYGTSQIEDNIVDVTDTINKNKSLIFDFLESVIGYNYILVHKIGMTTHYVDLRTQQDMKKLLGSKIKKAEIWYGGKNGRGKVVYCNIELDHMDINFNFRDKQGGVYPKSLMADYTIHH